MGRRENRRTAARGVRGVGQETSRSEVGDQVEQWGKIPDLFVCPNRGEGLFFVVLLPFHFRPVF